MPDGSGLASLIGILPSSIGFYLVGAFATLLVAASKGAFGGGLAIAGVPLLALVMDPIIAAIMLAPMLVVMDLFALRTFPPATWSKQDLRLMLPGLVLGIGLGWLIFELVDRRLVVLLIGVITVAFTARWFFKHRLNPPKPHGVQPVRAFGLSIASGFTTFVAHAGGPPVMMYMLGRGFSKTVLAGTSMALFFCGNVLKLAPYGKLAMEAPLAVAGALVFAPLIPLGIWLGKSLHDRLNEARLYFWIYVLLAITGTKLVVDGLRALMA
jgi:uncharacterized protein